MSRKGGRDPPRNTAGSPDSYCPLIHGMIEKTGQLTVAIPSATAMAFTALGRSITLSKSMPS